MYCKHLNKAIATGDVIVETTTKRFGGRLIVCYRFRIAEVVLIYCPFCGQWLPEWEALS